MRSNLATQANRIAADIEALAVITEPDRPWTRRAFTPKFLQGRVWLEKRFREAGLETHVDAAGNLIGRRRGSRPGRGTIMVGSHSDTVPAGGRFDGVAGVVAGLEIARALVDGGIALHHDFEVVDFLAEEVSIFGVSCVGSRGMAGVRPDEWLDRGTEELSLREGIAQVGGDPGGIALRSDIKAFLELHIEQGPVLEAENIDVGVVTAIAGITRIEIWVEGRADHAGTTPMLARRDALSTAARVTLAIEALAARLAVGATHFTATTGEFDVEPNAANVVPSRVRMLIDVRAEVREQMERFLAGLDQIVQELSSPRGAVVRQPVIVSDNMPAPCDPLILSVLDASCAAVGATHRRMASGAGHDTAWMTRIARSGMVFIPCKDGRSHAPEEFAEIEDIALGTEVLLRAVQRLDEELD